MEDYANDIILGIMDKSNVYITDGRRFVQKEKKRYDLIHMGVFNAWCSGCGNVFTKEFLQMLKNRLAPHGVVTYNAYPSAVKAGLGVFENLVLLSPGSSRISEVCASNEKIEFDPNKFKINLQNLRKESGAGSVRINWKYIREGTIIPKERVASFLGGISESTDDKPVTEYFLTNNQFTYPVDWKVFKPKKDMRIFECNECARPPFIGADNEVGNNSIK